MDRWATKDRYERETEESQRLVRPAPKIKPPRKDLRRERVNPDRDPDIDDDPDIAHDKDLSLNYKNIGGSIAARVVSRFFYGYDPTAMRVAARFIRADKEDGHGAGGFVSVINKETGEPTHVKPETLKGPEGKKYEVVKEDEEKPPKDFAQARQQLDKMMKDDPEFKAVLRGLMIQDKKDALYHFTEQAPEAAAKTFMRGRQLPEGIETLGDLKSALSAEPPKKPKGRKGPEEPAPAKKKPAAPEKPEAEDSAQTPKEGPTTPSAERPSEAPKDTPGTKQPSGEGEDDPSSYEMGPPPQEKDALKSWMAEKGPEQPDFKAWEKKQKTVTEKDGQALYRSKNQLLPFDQLSAGEQAKIKSRYEEDVKGDRNVEAVKRLGEDPKTRDTLRALANPDSPLRQRIEHEAREERRDLGESDIAKTIPELAHLNLPSTISSVQDLLDAVDKSFAPPPEPKRSKINKQEQLRSDAAIEENLPEDVAAQVQAMGLHPHDVSDLLSGYKAAMSVDVPDEDITKIAGTLAKGGGFNLDPESIETPKEFYLDGEKVKFEDLSPEDQAEVFQKYKMHVVATSLAARQRISDHLAEAGLPETVAQVISEHMLKSGSKDLPDHTVQQFFSHAVAMAMAEGPLDDEEAKKVLGSVGDNPAARKLVAAYIQAANYTEAREKWLSDPETRITEHDDPAKIARKLEQASEFLKKRSEVLPKDVRVVDAGMEFRNRVMDRMSYLAGDKVPFIREYLKDYEMEDFEAHERQVKKLQKEYDKALKKEAEAAEEEGWEKPYDPYRAATEEEAEARLAKKGVFPPDKPLQPPGYDHWKNRKKVEESSKGVFDRLRDFFKGKQASLTVEQRVLLRTLNPNIAEKVTFCHAARGLGPVYSSYPASWTMGQSSPGVVTAVYWGQQPYEQTAPYQGATQLQARDFDAQDFDNILKAAREWLKLPVLGRKIKGLYPDTQFRAALDLALRDLDNGKYSVGVYPTVYHELLARLSGRPGPYELLTGQPDDVPVAGGKQAGRSTYGATTERGSTMKASAQVRSFASRAASATPDSELAFDLMAFADHLAAEEAQEGQGQQQGQAEQQKQAAIRIAAQHQNKFTAVRSLVIRQAAQYPQLREVFLPILQAVK